MRAGRAPGKEELAGSSGAEGAPGTADSTRARSGATPNTPPEVLEGCASPVPGRGGLQARTSGDGLDVPHLDA